MDVATLKAKIKSKQLPSYLIFAGEEWKVQQIYIEQIAKVVDKEIKYIDSVSDIYGILRSKSFIQKQYIYIVRDDPDLMQNEKLWSQIETGLLGNNILIHLITQIDKRSKFYKHYSAKIFDFEQLSDSMLIKYLKKEINLSERNLMRLIEVCEHDYGRCLLEIDKIKRFEKWNTAPNITPNDCFQVLLEEGTIHEPAYDAVFDFVNVVLDRRVDWAFDLLSQCYEVGESTFVMLTNLYTSTKSVLQVQSYSGKELSKVSGLTGWQIKNAVRHCGKYSEKELIYILRLIQKIDHGIKYGRMDEQFAMQYLLVHIL